MKPFRLILWPGGKQRNIPGFQLASGACVLPGYGVRFESVGHMLRLCCRRAGEHVQWL